MNYKKTKYKTHLESNYWQQVKRKVKLRDNFTCIIKGCGKKVNLETHHITYQVFGFSIIGYELQYLQWLVTLCENCHHSVHKNKKHPLNPKNPLRINVVEFKIRQEQ